MEWSHVIWTPDVVDNNEDFRSVQQFSESRAGGMKRLEWWALSFLGPPEDEISNLLQAAIRIDLLSYRRPENPT